MRYFPAIILLFLLLIVLSDCSQNGCPGGMCPPDYYYASRRNQRRTMSFNNNYNKTPLISFRRTGTGWSRSNNQFRVSHRRYSGGKPLSFKSNYRRTPWLSFIGSGTGWSRRLNQNKVSLRRQNIEDPGASLSLDKGGNYVSNINSLDYDASAVKNRQSRFLNKRKIMAGRGGHQEGLWSPQMQNWKSKVGNDTKKPAKQKVKTKKLR